MQNFSTVPQTRRVLSNFEADMTIISVLVVARRLPFTTRDQQRLPVLLYSSDFSRQHCISRLSGQHCGNILDVEIAANDVQHACGSRIFASNFRHRYFPALLVRCPCLPRGDDRASRCETELLEVPKQPIWRQNFRHG